MFKPQLATCSAAALMLLAAAPGHAALVYATNSNGMLLKFDSNTPASANIVGSLGLPGDSLVGIDFRPATDALYGLGASGFLYTINTATGAATQFGSALTLSGTFFGVDFNPTVDRLRITSNADQDLRVNPATGVVANTDPNLAYAALDTNFGQNPNVVASAYTNSFNGATTTMLYNIDSVLGILTTQNPPNNGTLNTVGSLGLGTNLSQSIGFDIATPGNGGQAFASIGSALYTVNLATGAATSLGTIGVNQTITGIAVATPEPGTIILVGFGMVGSFLWRRRRFNQSK